MFPLLLVTLAQLANAAEIQLISSEPVTMEVDGRVVTGRPGERGATATDLAGGAHRVQIFDAQDRLLTTTTVTATVQEQVRLELRRGQLSELGRGPLPTAAPAAVCPEPPPPPAPEPGTLQLTAVRGEDVAMWVDGKPVRFTSGSFVATSVSAGLHDVRVVRGSATLFAGQMRVYPGLVRRCVPEGAELDCVHVEAVVSLPPKPAVVEKPAVVTAPPPARPSPMNDRDFTSFVAAVKAESFGSDQMGVIQSVVRANWFTVAQVGVVLDQLTHSSEKVEAATLLAPRVLDPENAYKLNEHLTFSSDKEAVRALFR
jgi:hypothetical protein